MGYDPEGIKSFSPALAQLSTVQTGLESIQETLEKQLSKSQSAVVVDFAPLKPTLESLRASIEKRMNRGGGKGDDDGDRKDNKRAASQLHNALTALREDLSRAITSVQNDATAQRFASVSHEIKMLHEMLATLKDVATQQRNHLRNVEELLVARAKQGTVELDITQEMLANEKGFLERVQEVLAGAQPEKTSTDSPQKTN